MHDIALHKSDRKHMFTELYNILAIIYT